MDAQRFDRLARALATPASRRLLLRALATGALGGLLARRLRGASPVEAFEFGEDEQIVRAALGDQLSPEALGWVLDAYRGGPAPADPHQLSAARYFVNAPDRTAICASWEAGIDAPLTLAVALSAPQGTDQRTLVDRRGALQAFGQVVRALADFYAQTNWIDLGVNTGQLRLAESLFGTDCLPALLPAGLQSGPAFNKERPDQGHGRERALPDGTTYHQLAVEMTTEAIRRAWDVLFARIIATYGDTTCSDTACLFHKLARDDTAACGCGPTCCNGTCCEPGTRCCGTSCCPDNLPCCGQGSTGRCCPEGTSCCGVGHAAFCCHGDCCDKFAGLCCDPTQVCGLTPTGNLECRCGLDPILAAKGIEAPTTPCGGACCLAGYHCDGTRCVRAGGGGGGTIPCANCPTPANATATCDNNTCGFACNAGFHRCGNACVRDTDLATCGQGCTPCPAPDPATGMAWCDGTRCGFDCYPEQEGYPGYKRCCPQGPQGCATCIPLANCCADADCPAGSGQTCQHGACACPSGQRDCHGTCIPSTGCCTDADCAPDRSQVCQPGTWTCVCAPDRAPCGSVCCLPHHPCCGGVCAPTADATCCLAPGQTCPPGQTCVCPAEETCCCPPGTTCPTYHCCPPAASCCDDGTCCPSGTSCLTGGGCA